MLLSHSEAAWPSEWRCHHLTNADKTSLHYTSLYWALQMLHFLQRKARPPAAKKITTPFIATLTLCWWPGTHTADSPGCIYHLPVPPLSYLRLFRWKSCYIWGFPAWLVIWIPSECFKQNKWHTPRNFWILVQRHVQWWAFLQSLTDAWVGTWLWGPMSILCSAKTSAGTVAETQRVLKWKIL